MRERFFLIPDGRIIALFADKKHVNTWSKYCLSRGLNKHFSGYSLGLPCLTEGGFIISWIPREVDKTEELYEELFL